MSVIIEVQKIKYDLVGLINSQCYQKCKLYLEKLHTTYPKLYEKPNFRPMFDVQWNTFFTKTRRNYGGEKVWRLTKPVIVFRDGELIGDEEDLLAFIKKEYCISIVRDFDQIARNEVQNYFQNHFADGHDFVYFIIAIDSKLVGTLLFELYTDLLPFTCFRFIRLCKRKYLGYKNSPIQRIAKPSWIQCGGWRIKSKPMVCENYIISHDRRGVLSMCHDGKHRDNSTQFFVTLSPAPWMDYKYVALGQLIHGEDVLKAIENVPTYYESPLYDIQIVDCGEFTLHEPYPDDTIEDLHKYLSFKPPQGLLQARDVQSQLFEERYLLGKYFLTTDMQSHKPFCHLPDYLLDKELIKHLGEMEGEGRPTEEKPTKEPSFSASWRSVSSEDEMSEEPIMDDEKLLEINDLDLSLKSVSGEIKVDATVQVSGAAPPPLEDETVTEIDETLAEISQVIPEEVSPAELPPEELPTEPPPTDNPQEEPIAEENPPAE